jgi:hypothetical protein
MLVEGKPNLVMTFPSGKGTAGIIVRDAGVDVIVVAP